MLNNYSNSTYNSLQVEARHRAASGLEFTANYTFSKVLSDTPGDSQNRIEHFLDFNNPADRSCTGQFRSEHSIKGTAVYDLPFGKDHVLHYRPVNKVIEGWSLGGIMSWQSGAPFSILSGYGTLNRVGRSPVAIQHGQYSADNVATERLVQVPDDRQRSLHGLAIGHQSGRRYGHEQYWRRPIHRPDFLESRRGHNRNPAAAPVLRPWSFDLDMSLQRKFRITERQSIELRMEGVNVLNHPTFYVGDQNINSTTFGVIGSMLTTPAHHAVRCALSILKTQPST